MTIQLKKIIIPLLFLVICASFSSCVKDGELTPRVIVGEWYFTKVDGNPIDDEVIIWKFEKDGGFDISSDGDFYEGDWAWNSDKTKLTINFSHTKSEEVYPTELEIEVLDKKTLEGSWDYDNDTLLVEFERK